jgi:hypothetical protein
MPAAVDSCVTSLLAKWEKDPSSRPKPKEEGQDAKSQAWAICQDAYNKRTKASLEMMFEGGMGPALLGAAATNRPYIPQLKPTKVIEDEDGEKKFLVHLANSGQFAHPLSGPFVLNHQVFSSMIANFDARAIGQDAAYDCRHRPDDGAYGWFERLMFGSAIGEGEKEFWGQVKPTEVGLTRIEGGQFKYSSMEFHLNYNRSDVVLDLEDATTDFCTVGLEEGLSEEEPEGDEPQEDEPEVNMPDKETVALEEHRTALDELDRLKKQQADEAEARKEAEKRAEEARALMLEMQQEALETSVQAVVELAQTTVDEDGNGLPRPLVDWIAKVLRFEAIGEEEKVVKLSGDPSASPEVQKYLIGAMKHLVLSMPGAVPVERKSVDGSDPEDDKFDYKGEWED